MQKIKRLLYLSITFCFLSCLVPVVGLAESDIQPDEVSEEAVILVEELTLSTEPESTSLTIGSTVNLKVTILPADAGNKNIIWTSNNQTCATVDNNGLVTAVSAGTVIIKALAADGGGAFDEIQLEIAPALNTPEPSDGADENNPNDPDNTSNKTPEEQLREEISLGGEVEFKEDLLLSSDLTIPENTQLTLSGKLTIPETLTLTNRGTVVLKSAADIFGVLDNRETGTMEFSPLSPVSEAMMFFSPADHPKSELRNGGVINLHGRLVLESNESFSNDQVPIVIFDGGSLNGSSNFVISSNVSSDTENIGTLPGASLKEYIESFSGSQVIEVDGDYVIDQPFTIESGKILKITSGSITVAQNVTLVNKGCLEISNGALVVQEGALLDNQCFIVVSDSGCLSIMEQGAYRSNNDAILQLNQLTAGSSASITGIDLSEIECSVTAESISQLKSKLQIEGYRFLTVYVNDADMLNRTDLSIPANKAISTLP